MKLIERYAIRKDVYAYFKKWRYSEKAVDGLMEGVIDFPERLSANKGGLTETRKAELQAMSLNE